MITLRVIIDEMLAPTSGSVGRYTEELTRELINAAPRGCIVEGFVSASTESDYQQIADRLPGLAKLHKSSLARRELRAAWQHGFTRLPGRGMLHAPSLLAPLSRHDRLNEGDQIIVTVHDTLAWSNPDSLGSRTVAWHKHMMKRAQKHADAVVVPSHTVAGQLAEVADFGDRIRVISGAGSTVLTVPGDAAERAARLDLSGRYVLAIGGLEPRKGIDQLVRAMQHVRPGVPLLIVGPEPDDEQLAAALVEAGLDTKRVRALGRLSNQDLAVVIDRAAVFAYPNVEEGLGMPVLEAFALGTPVVHSNAPAFLELTADAGIAVDGSDEDYYPEALAEGINSVLDDDTIATRLGYAGRDRAKMFSWRNSAEKIWHLHADL